MLHQNTISSPKTSVRESARFLALVCWQLTAGFGFTQTFVKITDPANPITAVEPSTNGYVGASWIDYNNDGRLDLFANRLYLYRNDGGGVFSKIVSSLGVNQLQTIGSGNSWADYDNDGDLDCFYSGRTSRLYRNDGDDKFTAINTGDIGDSTAMRGWACAWADYDNDGNVDLVITHPAGFVGQDLPATPNHLLHNDGPPNYTFTRVTGNPIVTGLAPYTVATWSDYDNDGDVDLFIGSGPAGPVLAVDFLYENLFKDTGVALFDRIGTTPIATDLVDGQVWNWIDYDNDGDLDAYLTNYGGGQSPRGLPNNLYRNDNGSFVRMSGAQVGSIVTDREMSLANLWGDFDNDGDLDALVTKETGYTTRYYQNDGDGTFTSVNAGTLTSGIGQHSGAAAGDYDNDGDLDLYLTGAGATKALYRNDLSNGNHWINILCEGKVSNRAGIGAKVRAKATLAGKPFWQLREISSQNSFNGHNMLNAHFGLGDAVVIDSLKLEWPSGMVDVHTNVAADRFLLAVEGEAIRTGVKEQGPAVPSAFVLHQNYPNPFNPATKIRFSLPAAQFVTLKVFDVSGRTVSVLIHERISAGDHELVLQTSQLCGSGVYLYQLTAGAFRQTRKMIVVE
ncbi:MAG: FG-GAP-like repeat-containing protein [bacterium]